MKETSLVDRLRELTPRRISRWAGSTIFNRGKGCTHAVLEVRRRDEFTLVSWVEGTNTYATSVQIGEGGKVYPYCSCPYDGKPCKHAVALVLAAIDLASEGETIRRISGTDQLCKALDSGYIAEFGEPAPWESDEEDNRWDEGNGPLQPVLLTTQEFDDFERVVKSKAKKELVELTLDLAGSDPASVKEVLKTSRPGENALGDAVKSVRAEIRRLTKIDPWYNGWKRIGKIPDYTNVRAQLTVLLKEGHADTVISLGELLWSKGIEQIMRSNDDGATFDQLFECYGIVVKAVKESTMPTSSKLRWIISQKLEDSWDLLRSGDDMLNSRSNKKEDWHSVAAMIEERFRALPKKDRPDYSDRHTRTLVIDWLSLAYERSGWSDRAIELLESEIEYCQNYSKLVDMLIRKGDMDKARKWCMRGFEKTEASLPGIAHQLRAMLAKMASLEGRHDLAAANCAQEFFEEPGRETYNKLRGAAEKASCWAPVRAGIMEYMETGVRCDLTAKKKSKIPWPLPVPEIEPSEKLRYRRNGPFPLVPVLLNIALMEERYEDVVALYKRYEKTPIMGIGLDTTVADAMIGRYPQIILDIWRKFADEQIRRAVPGGYYNAAGYLRKMLKVYKATKRMDEWRQLLDELRTTHKGKPRFLKELEKLPQV